MCAKTVYEYSSEMNNYVISPGSIDETLDFPEIFGNTQPVEIEIGTGKGRFILAEARQRPEANFLGIERSLKWMRVALLRQTRDPRPNVRFLNLNADLVVKLLLSPDEVQAFHVYFPDPWHKKRHHKRRLFNPRFIEKMSHALKPDGHLFFKSDHEEYFQEAHDNISSSGFFHLLERKESTETITDFDEANENATHYEIKWRLEARPIYSAIYRVQK